MKIITQIAAILLIAVLAASAASGTACASTPTDDYRNYKGIWLGVASTDKDNESEWTFSLINLTNSIIHTGASTEVPYVLSDSFPYNTDFPSGNSKGSKVNLTTWKSHKGAHPFPGQYEAFVNFHIKDGTSLYDFSLRFLMYSSGGVPDGSCTYVYFQPVYNSTTWKYSNQVSNDHGYYADPPRTYSSGSGMREGIVFAISDKYVLSLYKPNEFDHGENQLFLVVTQRFTNNANQGNHLQWLLM